MTSTLKFNKAKDIFRAHGGILNTAKAIRLGIHPKTLYNMRDQGILDPLSRGLYRLTEFPEISQPDLIIRPLSKLMNSIPSYRFRRLS